MASRREFLVSMGSVGVTAALASQPAWAAGKTGAGRYAQSIIVDALGGPDLFDSKTDPTGERMRKELANIRASGIAAVNLTMGDVGNGPDGYDNAIRSIAEVEGHIAAHPDFLTRIRTAQDIRDAKASGRLGLIYGFQDTSMLDGDIGRVALFRNLGVRIVQLTYNRRNLMGDGCLEPADGGLSVLGRELIEELDRLDLLLDLSHAGPRTIEQGIAASKGPLAITHTGCRDLMDVPRNTSDRNLRALADKGGVAGIYFMPFLRASGQPRAEDLIRHLEHAVKVCGEDHVGLGTDGPISGVTLDAAAAKAQREFFEKRKQAGIAAPGEAADVFNLIPEYNDPGRFMTLADDLSRRGWSSGRIEKVLGGNFVRLFEAVWGA